MSDDAGLSDAVAELLGLLVDETAQQTLTRIADLARRTVRGCDACSVAVVPDGSPTIVATDPSLCDAEERQYRASAGPGAAAFAAGLTVDVHSLGDEVARWPAYAAGVRDAGYASVVAVPLRVGAATLGALALYARMPGALADRGAAADHFAALAAVAIANARLYAAARDVTDHLRAAGDDVSDTVEQAKGIVLAERHCTPDEALEWLRQRSRDTSEDVREVAAAVVGARTSLAP